MTTVKRAEFLERFDDGIDLHDADLQQDLTKLGLSAATLSQADQNGDGLLKGRAELGALFKLVDAFDKNGDNASFELTGKPELLQFVLLEGRINPPGARTEFRAALKRDPAEASRVLNGMSMLDVLKTLDGLPTASRAEMISQARRQGLDAERLEYADHILSNRCLPNPAPGDLEATGQVATAEHFIQIRSGEAPGSDPETVRVVRAIVSASEGKPDSVQTKDSGVVSYGKYQFTLASGSLKDVLNDYVQRCRDVQGNLPTDSDAAKIENFMGRVGGKDGSLRNDAEFRAALISAGHDPRMLDAQEATFQRSYLEPARAAVKLDRLFALSACHLYGHQCARRA